MHQPGKRILIMLLSGILILAMGVGCATQSAQPNTEADTPAAGPVVQVPPIVSATGEVTPRLWTTLSFQLPGRVIAITVEEGDEVKEGDVIAVLDSTELEAQLAQVQVALLGAKARLNKLEAGPRKEDVDAARQRLYAAQARIAAASARRDALYSSITEAQIIEAENNLKAAQKRLDDLQKSMDDLIGIDQSQYEPDDPNPLAGGEMLAWEIELAQLEVDAAQVYLDDLLDGPNPDSVRVANARIWLASAQAAAAKAQLDFLLAGASDEDIAVAKAEIDQAASDVDVTVAQLGQIELVAPFDGTITDVFIDLNAYIAPGQMIVQIADLSSLRVETTDLNEIDVARVHTGDTVTVTFDALPDLEITGTVTRIAPKSTEGAGVNYTVVIDLEDLPAALRWGMTAFVDIRVQ